MRILLATVALLVALPCAANAEVLINNGLDCSNPGNVIDYPTLAGFAVRNEGCGTTPYDPWGPCASPGDATEVCLVDGGAVVNLPAYDSSTITMTGGGVSLSLRAHDSSNVIMSGGTVGVSLIGWDSSSITMSAGTVWALYAADSSTATMSGGTVKLLLAYDSSSTIMIVGSGFKVDGVPVPYGDLTARSGELTGTLASGEPIDSSFSRDSRFPPPPSVPVSDPGTITLIPSVVPSAVIDVQPGNRENEISGRRRVPIQVAILGWAGLDVRDVDVTTLRFGPGEASPALDLTHPSTYGRSLRDVNGDGEDDLVPVFLYGDTELPLGESLACLTGEIAGEPFTACDTVLVFLPGCGRGFELALLLPPLVWLRGRQRRVA